MEVTCCRMARCTTCVTLVGCSIRGFGRSSSRSWSVSGSCRLRSRASGSQASYRHGPRLRRSRRRLRLIRSPSFAIRRSLVWPEAGNRWPDHPSCGRWRPQGRWPSCFVTAAGTSPLDAGVPVEALEIRPAALRQVAEDLHVAAEADKLRVNQFGIHRDAQLQANPGRTRTRDSATRMLLRADQYSRSSMSGSGCGGRNPIAIATPILLGPPLGGACQLGESRSGDRSPL